MKYSKIIGLTIVASAALLTACTDDLANIFNSEHEIAFEVKTTSANDTRATNSIPEIEPVKLTADNGETYYLHTDITPMSESIQPADTSAAVTRGVTADATSLHNGFGVSAYNTDGTTEGISYFLNSNTSYTTVSATDVYTPIGAGSGKYWPKGKLNFYAYYPYTSAVTGTDSEDTHGLSRSTDGKTIKYVVPSTPANQPDLMTAKLENQQYSSGDGRAALTFNHALCAISFKTGTDIAGGTINSITFNNVYTEGKYDISTGTWSDTSAGDVTITKEVNTTEGTANISILTDNNTLMLIPQDFANDNDASITIDFTDANSINHTLNHKLKDSEWGKGYHITYTVTTEDLVGYDYHLEVSGGGITYSGGNVTCTVSSYRTIIETSENQNVAWSVIGYSTDGGSTWSEEAPSWLTLASTSGTGSVSATNVKASVGASTSVTEEQALKNATPKGSSDEYYDLSKHNVRGDETSQNTANCYVVNAPGYYMFPTVYGNAIKDGAANTSAYHTDNSGTNILTNFVDHNNSAIYTGSANDPYIQSKYTPDNVVLVWQDAQNLIEYSTPGELSYDGETGYVKFHISSTNINQGNAVIAIRTGSTILWSWHIWVTPKDIATTIPVTAANTDYIYDFMSINLGWCGWENTSSYANRYILVKIRQSKSGYTKIIKISQYSDSGLSKTGDNPYYEWGRKDPFLPGTDVNYGNKTYQGNYTWGYTWGQTSISNAIQNPFYKWSVSNGNWCSTYYLNLWDTNNTQTSLNYNNVIKTVYDPCPPGFKVPSVAAYSGFVSTSNGNTGVVSNGLFFYTNSTKNNTIFIPGVGYRDSYNDSGRSAGETYQVNALHGAYHTCTPSDNSHNFNLYYFNASGVYVSAVYGTMAYAFCMRPIAE